MDSRGYKAQPPAQPHSGVGVDRPVRLWDDTSAALEDNRRNHQDRCHHSAHGTAGANTAGSGAWEAWAFSGPSGGDDVGARITVDPTRPPVAISLAPTTPALPTGPVRSPLVRPPEMGPSAAVLG
jgi:hypothetical protein